MKKLFFNIFPVFLTWVLGHVFLYTYFGFLPSYAAMNLFTMVVWICLYFYTHYKWAYFIINKIKNIYVGIYDARNHS